MSATIEKYELKKEITRNYNRLHYIKNRDRILEKSKNKKRINKPWSERADNPKNKNSITFKKYYSELKINLFKNYVWFNEGMHKNTT